MATGRVPKSTAGKVRVDLVPLTAVRAVADVMTFGAKKYSDRGYVGMHLMELWAANRRHADDWALGIDDDPETGLSHLAHASANTLMMHELLLAGECVDDRPTMWQHHLKTVARSRRTR